MQTPAGFADCPLQQLHIVTEVIELLFTPVLPSFPALPLRAARRHCAPHAHSETQQMTQPKGSAVLTDG